MPIAATVSKLAARTDTYFALDRRESLSQLRSGVKWTTV
jgi:hypothetical protein